MIWLGSLLALFCKFVLNRYQSVTHLGLFKSRCKGSVVICTALWEGLFLMAALQHSLDDSDSGSRPDTDVFHLISLPYLKKGSFSLRQPLTEAVRQLKWSWRRSVYFHVCISGWARFPLNTLTLNMNFTNNICFISRNSFSYSTCEFIDNGRHLRLELGRCGLFFCKTLAMFTCL